MKKMSIFEPAMCCSTGLCGPGVNPDLLRVSTVLNNINRNGVIVERYNLTNNPQLFVDNKMINQLLNSHGIEILPVTIVEGVVVKTKQYPTNEEFSKLLEIPEHNFKSSVRIKAKAVCKDTECGCKSGCC